jgi:hypothetical protein
MEEEYSGDGRRTTSLMARESTTAKSSQWTENIEHGRK